ncbi:MAG: hypothetical protein AAF569_06450 [Pseudomonadota bacterium]
MLDFYHKADVASRIHYAIQTLSEEPGQGTDGMKSMLLLSGMLVETVFLFENCEEGLDCSFDQLAEMLGCEPTEGAFDRQVLPPATIMDFDTEQGRAMAREFFEEWLDCAYEFHTMLINLVHQYFMQWEAMGQPRAESFRLLVECTHKSMSYELAAQELCDVIIEQKIGREGWSLGDSVAALSGAAGHKLGLSQDGMNECCWFYGPDLPDLLDQTAFVMTQEAVRLGLSAAPDWRFGLPANDVPANPPSLLIANLDPICRSFFEAIQMADMADQAVACAKAAGRMIAVAAGGERPEIEPNIVKPLAMAAITESYKSICRDYAVAR